MIFINDQLGRILSLCWHSSGDFIVTGSTDAIRVWNVKTGHAVNRLSPGRAQRNKVTTHRVANFIKQLVKIKTNLAPFKN